MAPSLELRLLVEYPRDRIRRSPIRIYSASKNGLQRAVLGYGNSSSEDMIVSIAWA
jgi:hypothetical protein